ncbi:MAG: hypothetical protein M4579_002163 [Chaenotheca gracillima]|nr:MAG: hypothetical protein M4579_002163 [Chaenotheca gracillima]
MSILNAGGLSRHPTALAKEFDHEISLVDSTQTTESARPSRPTSPPGPESSSNSTASTGASTSKTGDPGQSISRKWTLREELAKRKYSKWQESKFAGKVDANDLDDAGEDGAPDDGPGYGILGRPSQIEDFATGASGPSKGPVQKVTERFSRHQKLVVPKNKKAYEVDILYENQRGWFFCGIPLFGHNSLLNFDPSPWETSNFKDSPVDITNAQPPDPSWEWVWKSWYVDMSPDVDEEGWQYSFSFSPAFSWHGTHVWFHSFVRRRRWLRKRAKRRHARGPGDFGAEVKMREGHMLNSDYFTIHPRRDRSPTSSLETGGGRSSFPGASGREEDSEEEDLRDVRDIGSLMKTVKTGKIDREKIDAVESFIHQGGEEIYYLTERMPEIMSNFVFQASRRQLLAHLVQHYNQTSEKPKSQDEADQPDEEERARLNRNLQNAIHAAEDQVKKLEYWSDVKHIAKQGESISAVDESKGWTEGWQGLDSSGPADLDAGRKLPIGNSFAEDDKRTEARSPDNDPTEEFLTPSGEVGDKGKGRE